MSGGDPGGLSAAEAFDPSSEVQIPGGGRIPTAANMLISSLQYESEESFLTRLEVLSRPHPAAAVNSPPLRPIPGPIAEYGGSGSSSHGSAAAAVAVAAGGGGSGSGIFTRLPSVFNRPPPISGIRSSQLFSPLAPIPAPSPWKPQYPDPHHGNVDLQIDAMAASAGGSYLGSGVEETFHTFTSPFYSADRGGSKAFSRAVRGGERLEGGRGERADSEKWRE